MTDTAIETQTQLARLGRTAKRLHTEWQALRPAFDRAFDRYSKRLERGEPRERAARLYDAAITPANNKLDELSAAVLAIHEATPRTAEDWAVKFWALKYDLDLGGDPAVSVDEWDYPDAMFELFSGHVRAAVAAAPTE